MAENKNVNAYLESQGQYIRSASVMVPNAPAIFSMMDNPPEVDVQCNVDANKLNESLFEVILTVHTEAKIDDKEDQGEKKVAFSCDLQYSGLFSVGATEDEEKIKKLLLVDAAAILFPFARRVVANLTMDSGFPPLMLAPIDFAAKYQAQSDAEAKH